MLCDALLITGTGFLSYKIFLIVNNYTIYIDENLLVGIILSLMFINNFTMGRLKLYSDKRYSSISIIAQKIALALFIEFILIKFALLFLKLNINIDLYLFIYFFNLFLMLIALRLILESYLNYKQSNGFNSRKILLVGSNSRLECVLQALEKQKSWGHQVIGYLKSDNNQSPIDDLPQLGYLEDLKNVCDEHAVDEVVFALPATGNNINLKDAIKLCEWIGITYRIVPALFDPSSTRRLNVESIQNIPTLTVNMVRINPSGILYKRCLDYFLGTIGLLLLALVFPVIALAIKLDSPGPIFFRQRRVGRNKRIFNIYKFRTMFIDAEERKKSLTTGNQMNGCIFKIQNDPRITRVGRLLRKTSLDELPQFINVLKGEMSVVGTRPPTLDEVEKYELWHRRRISIQPGITGLWQISGRNKISDFDEIVRLDLKYIDNWRFLDDLIIIFKTFFVVLNRKGAY